MLVDEELVVDEREMADAIGALEVRHFVDDLLRRTRTPGPIGELVDVAERALKRAAARRLVVEILDGARVLRHVDHVESGQRKVVELQEFALRPLEDDAATFDS